MQKARQGVPSSPLHLCLRSSEIHLLWPFTVSEKSFFSGAQEHDDRPSKLESAAKSLFWPFSVFLLRLSSKGTAHAPRLIWLSTEIHRNPQFGKREYTVEWNKKLFVDICRGEILVLCVIFKGNQWMCDTSSRDVSNLILSKLSTENRLVGLMIKDY